MIDIAPLATDTVRDRRSRGGSSGALERDSTARNEPSRAVEPTIDEAATGSPQPAVVARVNRVHEEHQPGGGGHCSCNVEVPMPDHRGAAFRQERRGERDRGDGNWNVDEEDPRPREIGREYAAQEDTDRGAAARHGSVEPEREVAVAALGEDRHQQRERGRRHERAAEPLNRPEDDERALRPSKSAQERAEAEDGKPRYKEPAASEDVGEPASEQQRAAEEDRVRRDDPLEARVRKVEVALDRG